MSVFSSSSSQKVLEQMYNMAAALYEKGEYQKAFSGWKNVADTGAASVENSSSVREIVSSSWYNMGILLSSGKLGEKNLLKAAEAFMKSKRLGIEENEKAVNACLREYISEDIGSVSAEELYEKACTFGEKIYSDKNAVFKLPALIQSAGIFWNNKNYAAAAKICRLAAQYGNSAEAQNFLAVLYNAGEGVEKNDIAALYWFRKAAVQGYEAAVKDMEGIIGAYKSGNMMEEAINELAECCRVGSADIPKDNEEALYWLSQKNN